MLDSQEASGQSRATPRPGTAREALDRYATLYERYRSELKQRSRSWGRLSYVRGSLFIASLILLGLGLGQFSGMGWPWFLLAGGAFIGFLVVAYVHEGIQSDIHRIRLMVQMYRESIARLQRRWDDIRVPAAHVPADSRAVAFDLDLIGDHSLYKLLGTPRTPLGIQTLVDWMLHGAAPKTVIDRQQGVEELAGEFEYRDEFALRCAVLESSRSGPTRFIEWAESRSWLDRRRWLLWTVRLTSAAVVLALVGWLSGLLPLVVAGPVVVAAFVVNFVLSVVFAGTIHNIFNQISSHHNEIAHYVRLFEMVTRYPATAEGLKSIQAKLRNEGDDVMDHVRRLGRLTWLAGMRSNGGMFLVYIVLEFLTFWDVHVLDRLEAWKQNHGAKARNWFQALGEWEVMLALAKLSADEPEWKFPRMRTPEEPVMVEATQLGHPLLDESRVPNDVAVGPPGTVLLVTGSNMSGKSTLLRSIGVNVVLAQMGSVVCATSMSLSPVRVESSMRIVDSLADGVSFFMAELRRLKQIVDVARQQRLAGDRTLLFLLDEILQGTNSRERQIAVSRVVRKLIDEGAIGAISTHDLDLASTAELQNAVRTVHFTETFVDRDGATEMTFDYRMRPGLASTTNALKLLEMVGLGEHQ